MTEVSVNQEVALVVPTVLNPVDESVVATKINETLTKARNEVLELIKNTMPVSFSMCSDGSWVYICRTRDLGIYNIPSLSTSLAYKYNGRITFIENIKPIDVYRVNGLIQILSAIDVGILGEFCIKN